MHGGKGYGTIDVMSDHRVRLDDRELGLIVSALWARRRGVSAARARELERLAERLSEGKRGNPSWILGWVEAPQRAEATRGSD